MNWLILFVGPMLVNVLPLDGLPQPQESEERMNIWSPAANMHALLPSLFDALTNETVYQRHRFPAFRAGVPTTVNTSVYVKNFGPISEVQMSYDAELYISFTWHDSRLFFANRSDIGASPLSFFQLLSSSDQAKIWTPTVFFSNSANATLPDVLQKNSVIFVLPSGTVIQRTRVILNTACQMDLHDFPFDEQKCQLEISSFGYSDKQVLLKWGVPYVLRELADDDSSDRNETVGRNHTDDPSLAVFLSPAVKPVAFTLDRQLVVATDNTNVDSWQGVCSPANGCLVIQFAIERNYSFYLCDIYVSTLVISVLGLLSLWVDFNFVPARIILGVTTFLTLQTTSGNVRKRLPDVSYVKAVDIWLVGCQVVIFLAIMEFVVVHGISHGQFGRLSLSTRSGFSKDHIKILGHETEDDVAQEMLDVKAKRLNNILRILLPAAFVIMVVLYFIYYLVGF